MLNFSLYSSDLPQIFTHQNSVSEKAWVFLFPELDLQDGGHVAQQRLFSISEKQRDSAVVTYQQKAPNTPFLDDLLKQSSPQSDQRTYCIHYGPHVSKLCKKLRGRRIIYIAHSTGWSISLPRSASIICISKHTLGYWGKHAPYNRLFYLPNVLDESFCLPNKDQEIHLKERQHDVIVIARKMSPHLMQQLLPRLRKHCKVKVIDSWIDDIAIELKQAKIFLYDSVHHWQQKNVTEGFGLPPLEALACGCTVFSSVNDALAEYLEPGVNCFQIGSQAIESDIKQIVTCLENWQEPLEPHHFICRYRAENIAKQFANIAQLINT